MSMKFGSDVENTKLKRLSEPDFRYCGNVDGRLDRRYNEVIEDFLH